jgi:four helix bundle protein
MKKYTMLEELRVYQSAMEIEELVWETVIGWDYFQRDTVGKQVVRSADSIAANIAEGFGRYFFKENRKFCFYSRGSLQETKTWLYKAYNRKLLSKDKYEDLIAKLRICHKLLNNYIKSIGSNDQMTNDQ